MAGARKRLCYLFWFGLGWEALLAGCASAPTVLAIPPVTETVRPPAYGSKDYSQALAAITSVLVLELKLPPIDGALTVYPSDVSYQSGVVTESEKDLERLRKQLGPRANRLNEEEFIFAARRSAVSSVAVGNYKKVLVNGGRLGKYAWPDWIRVLAHELTHTVERELVEGRFIASDQWLREGFAEWVGYKVVDAFGAGTYENGRKAVLDAISIARSNQTFPGLNQLVRNAEWITWMRTLGRSATYGQALMAVDLLIEEKGLGALVEYFKLFLKLNNRERNFVSAFGEPLPVFQQRFDKHLATLLAR